MPSNKQVESREWIIRPEIRLKGTTGEPMLSCTFFGRRFKENR
jgi:hypothetical protein